MKIKNLVFILSICLSIQTIDAVSSMNMSQAYAILEIPNGSNLGDVKKAFRKLSLKWHPDRNINNKDVAEEKFKEINAAYEFLEKVLKKDNAAPEDSPEIKEKKQEIKNILDKAHFFFYGDSKKKINPDYQKAKDLYFQLTQQNVDLAVIPEAYNRLAQIYLNGSYGVIKNLIMARGYAKKAKNLGSTLADEILDEINKEKPESPVDDIEFEKEFKHQQEQSHTQKEKTEKEKQEKGRAEKEKRDKENAESERIIKLYNLGLNYFNSTDWTKAINAFKDVAQQNLFIQYKAASNAILATIYRFGGNGITKNYTLAKQYATEAINNGYNDKELLNEIKKEEQKEKIEKAYNLGYKYYSENNYAKAIEFFKKSVNQNIDKNSKAWSGACLAYIYQTGGKGVAKNYALAKQYAEIAVKNGYSNTNLLKEVIEAEKNDPLEKAKRAKALIALQAKQFKATSDNLAKQANVIWQFKTAQFAKNAKKAKQLTPQINKIKKELPKIPVNIKNAQGQTPIMLNPRIAPIIYALPKNKAKVLVNAKDKKGKTVLQYLITSPFANNINLYNALIVGGARVSNNDIKAVQIKLKKKPKVRDQVIKVLKIGQKKNK